VYDVDGWLGALGPAQTDAVDGAWVDKVKEQLRSMTELPLLTPAQADVVLSMAYSSRGFH
jgi:hypothetical protein